MSFALACRRYALPFRSPIRTAHGPWAVREGLIVRAEDESGNVGYGEVAPIPWFGTETVAEAAAALQTLSGRVSEAQIAALPAALACTHHGAREAIADCRAKSIGIDPAPPWPVAASLPAGREALAVAPPKADLGFRVFKWKVGVGEAADEIGLLDDLLARLPGGARLRLDANGAWDRRVAERWLERCAGRPIEFVEQPIAPTARGAEDLLLGLAADYPTPLALDESLVRDGDVARWLAAGWPGVFVVKPSLLADPAAACARLAAAKAAVVFSSALETAVGARSALAGAFHWSGARRALGFGVWPLFDDPRFNGPPAAPFVRTEDLTPLNAEAVWNALN